MLHTPPCAGWLCQGTQCQRWVVPGPLPIMGACTVLLLCLPGSRAGSIPWDQVANPKPPPAAPSSPGQQGGKLRHGEAAENKVSCSERTQMSWLQAQIHAQLHKDGTKETPNGCKPPPHTPPQPWQSSWVPDTAQLGTGWGDTTPRSV